MLSLSPGNQTTVEPEPSSIHIEARPSSWAEARVRVTHSSFSLLKRTAVLFGTAMGPAKNTQGRSRVMDLANDGQQKSMPGGVLEEGLSPPDTQVQAQLAPACVPLLLLLARKAR